MADNRDLSSEKPVERPAAAAEDIAGQVGDGQAAGVDIHIPEEVLAGIPIEERQHILRAFSSVTQFCSTSSEPDLPASHL